MKITDTTINVPLAVMDDYQIYDNDIESSDLKGVCDLIDSLDKPNICNHVKNYNFMNANCEEVSRDKRISPSPETESFSETFGGSLEDLVSKFDEKISHCFQDFHQEIQNIAPVQLRTHEEIMAESQIWWTLTGNFGNILPIDWSSSCALKLQLPALHLTPRKLETVEDNRNNDLDISDDEDLAQALDLHSLIASQLSPMEPSPQTADEVIHEIDEIIMQQSCTNAWSDNKHITNARLSLKSSLSVSQTISSDIAPFDEHEDVTFFMKSEEDLWKLPYKDLVAMHSELERFINHYNAILVQELASKDEMEYAQERKHTFISLLRNIQRKRRQWSMDRKCKTTDTKSPSSPLFLNGESLPQYVTAIIPYDDKCTGLDIQSLEYLIKILEAIDENNQNVPNMLTDYILHVLKVSLDGKITKQRLSYFGHITRANSLKISIMLGKTSGKRRPGRQRTRRLDIVKADTGISINHVKEAVRDRKARRELIHKASESLQRLNG